LLTLCSCRAEVFAGASSSDVVSALKGRKLLGAHRKGKQMWLTLEGDEPNLLMHFGEHCTICGCCHWP
jgi:formamidopyrimidine-DNA glycosylase